MQMHIDGFVHSVQLVIQYKRLCCWQGNFSFQLEYNKGFICL